MLGIRTAEKADYDKIIRFLNHEQLPMPEGFNLEEKEWMILEDSDLVLGFAAAELRDLKPFVTHVYIPEKLRGHLMGDAVLRGLLYYMLGRKFDVAYADCHTDIAPFLIHEGFEEKGGVLTLALEDFFDRKCRGCRE